MVSKLLPLRRKVNTSRQPKITQGLPLHHPEKGAGYRLVAIQLWVKMIAKLKVQLKASLLQVLLKRAM